MQDRRRADGVAEQPGAEAAAAGARDLLHGDDAHEAVALGPAIGLGEAEAHVADGGGLFINLARELARLVPCIGERLDLLGDESAQRLAEGLVLGVVERAHADRAGGASGHRRDPRRPGAALTFDKIAGMASRPLPRRRCGGGRLYLNLRAVL